MLTNIELRSIIKKGGASISLNKYNNKLVISNLKNGYMVSLKDYEVKKYCRNLKSFKDNLNLYYERNKLELFNNLFLGIWIEKNTFYFDISCNILNFKKAIDMARNNNQLAIYDTVNCKSIYLNKLTYKM